ncbi:tail assembly protein [Enterobacteriaceae bacterium ML5]|nr:tail assembly protein [Enterobacteriaceae bacterium ML5]
MQEVMTRIDLGGSLGKIFGKTHNRSVKTTSEAVRALCCTLKDFERYLNNSKARGITFAVFRGKKNLVKDDLAFPVNGEVIRILPVIIGSKQAGLFQTILGAALIAVGAVMTYLSAGTASPLAAGFITSGAAMMAGGVIQMLSPQAGGLASKQDADNKASYAFGGVTNTTAQGNPVPLLYGKRRIGGAIISAGIYAEDQQ